MSRLVVLTRLEQQLAAEALTYTNFTTSRSEEAFVLRLAGSYRSASQVVVAFRDLRVLGDVIDALEDSTDSAAQALADELKAAVDLADLEDGLVTERKPACTRCDGVGRIVEDLPCEDGVTDLGPCPKCAPVTGTERQHG